MGTKSNKEPIVDPGSLWQGTPVQAADVQVGDFVAAQHWRRPRLVLAADQGEAGRTFIMREPDESRSNERGHRVVDAAEWERRGEWRRFDALTKVWAVAHGLPVKE